MKRAVLSLFFSVIFFVGCQSPESIRSDIQGNERLRAAIGEAIKSVAKSELGAAQEKLTYKSGDGFWKGAGKMLLYCGAEGLIQKLAVESVDYSSVDVDERALSIVLSNLGILPNASISGKVNLVNMGSVAFKAEIKQSNKGDYEFENLSYYINDQWNTLSDINNYL